MMEMVEEVFVYRRKRGFIVKKILRKSISL